MAPSLFWDSRKHFFYQISFGVNYSHAVSMLDILPGKIQKKSALSGTGWPNDMNMLAGISSLYGNRSLISREIGTRLDAPAAMAYAYDAKRIIRETVDKYGCSTIHLFYAGPLGLAILLGRLFNAMHASIQCYEEQQVGYTPTCLLRCD